MLSTISYNTYYYDCPILQIKESVVKVAKYLIWSLMHRMGQRVGFESRSRLAPGHMLLTTALSWWLSVSLLVPIFSSFPQPSTPALLSQQVPSPFVAGNLETAADAVLNPNTVCWEPVSAQWPFLLGAGVCPSPRLASSPPTLTPTPPTTPGTCANTILFLFCFSLDYFFLLLFLLSSSFLSLGLLPLMACPLLRPVAPSVSCLPGGWKKDPPRTAPMLPPQLPRSHRVAAEQELRPWLLTRGSGPFPHPTCSLWSVYQTTWSGHPLQE